ncbi:MAG: caspase family protein [Myxococcota bacterium]
MIAPVVAILGLSIFAPGPPATVALVIGNNASPVDETALAPLRFADDDAIRFYELFSRATDTVELLSVLDDTTQTRHPGVAGKARPPTLTQLDAAVSRLATRLQEAAAEGRSTRAYLTFSGHGSSREDGTPYLAFLDGELTGDALFSRVVARLPADRVHLIIDACNAGAMVGARGRFDREVDGERVELTEEALDAIAKTDALARYPHVGVIVAASAGQEAHEWARIESGVFTHEVLSALAGPADVNGDLAIEYSELQAFVASANSAVSDPRAKPTILARAPIAERRAPLLALQDLRETGFILGEPRGLGRFFVELGNGRRYLDAHLDPNAKAAIAIPANTPVYLRTEEREASIAAAPGAVVRFRELDLQSRAVASRGATDEEYRRSLFSVMYGATYYRGYVDSQSLVPVSFNGIATRTVEPLVSIDELVAYSAWGVGAAGLGVAVLSGVLAVQKRSDFNDTEIQREAQELANDYDALRLTAWLGVGVALAGAAVGFYFYPSSNAGAPTPVVVPNPDGSTAFGVGWSGEF